MRASSWRPARSRGRARNSQPASASNRSWGRSSTWLRATKLRGRLPADGRPSGHRAVAWTALGIGAAGVVVGTVLGIRAFDTKSEAQAECAGSACSQRGLDLFSDARVAANVSTVAFVAAAVAAGVGIY